ncbi:MAG: hypothetical protein JSU72_14805 [Deltaproteobacteria bacterium]|nr:MAG: hypothetical protein JSU72_14805 [Deltaproteobacteria bacterium]
MAVKALLIPGFAEPKRVWFDEARFVAQQLTWIDEVIVSGGNPLGSYQQRAEEILVEIEGRIKPENQLIVVGHSFGGIIARYMTSLGYLQPRYLVTIATPHRGIQHAEVYARSARDRIGPVLISWMFRRLYRFIASCFGADEEALFQLTIEEMRKFNEEYEDVESTTYLSYACVAEQVGTLLRIPQLLLSADTFEPNDSIITLESAKWGRFMGMVSCDHLEVVGSRGPNNFDSDQFLLSVFELIRDDFVTET